MRWLGWWKQQFEKQNWRWILAGIVLLIALPTLKNGLLADDHIHRNVFHGAASNGSSHKHPIMSMFSFFPNDPTTQKQQREWGVLPWWTSPRFFGSFWRPVSASTHWLDYQLWPDSPWLMHLQSVLWLLFAIGVAFFLYRSFLPQRWMIHAALTCYALHEGFAFPTAWIANRNALIAVAFGLLCLLLHHQWRTTRQNYLGIATYTCFLVALLSGESAIAILAYLFGYTLFMDRSSRFQRTLVFGAYLICVVSWRLLYNSLGYGMKASGLYTDPLHSPVAFLQNLLMKLPVLFLGEWATPSASIYLLLEGPALWAYVAFATLFLVFVLWMLRHLREQPVAMFLATGMLFSLIPATATAPHGRLLLFSSFGGMGLLVLLWEKLLATQEVSPSTNFPWLFRLVVVCVSVRLVISPFFLIGDSQGGPIVEKAACLLSDSITIPKGNEKQTLVILNSPLYILDLLTLERKRWRKQPIPERYRVLATGHRKLTLKRLDSHTLSLRTQRTFVILFGTLFRSPQDPMKPGEVVRLPDMTATVKAVDKDGYPTAVNFRFSVPLNSPKIKFLRATTKGYVVFQPPPVGKSVQVPSFPYLKWLFQDFL